MSENKGVMPPQVDALLRNISALGSPLGEAIEDEDIKRFVGAKLDIRDLGRRIPYSEIWRSLNPYDDDDPFNLDALAPAGDLNGYEPAPASSSARSEVYDRLLQWLSAVGTGSWEMFRNACRALGLDHEGMLARRIVRRLRLLGHLELAADGKHWSIAPSVLVAIGLHSDVEAYVLCGARDENLLHSLRSSSDVEVVPQIDGRAPTALVARFSEARESLLDLPAIRSGRLRLGGRVSDRLAQLLPPLMKWQQELESLQGILPHSNDLKWFDGVQFVDRTFDGETGLYQFWARQTGRVPESRPKYTLFYDAHAGRWLHGDWYGLRFLALQALGQQGHVQQDHVQYDRATARLAVTEMWRWPELYERALVLASGRLPVHAGGWVIYGAVSPDVVGKMCAKLNLTCQER